MSSHLTLNDIKLITYSDTVSVPFIET